MNTHSIKLEPQQDLRQALEAYANKNAVQAGFIITGVGSLEYATLRMAGAGSDSQDVRIFEGPLEITSLVGTVTVNGSHIHITVADKEGAVHGGHLNVGSPVRLMAKVVVGEDESYIEW